MKILPNVKIGIGTKYRFAITDGGGEGLRTITGDRGDYWDIFIKYDDGSRDIGLAIKSQFLDDVCKGVCILVK